MATAAERLLLTGAGTDGGAGTAAQMSDSDVEEGAPLQAESTFSWAARRRQRGIRGPAVLLVAAVSAAAILALVVHGTRRPAEGGLIGVASLAEATPPAAPPAEPPAEAEPPSEPAAPLAVAPAADEAAPAAPAGSGPCSKEGDSCLDSRCCSEVGKVCYESNEYWASCAYTCKKSENKTCKELGERTPKPDDVPCAAAGENCFTTRCCKDAGHACFTHDAYWAGCSGICEQIQGPNKTEAPPECEQLGERTVPGDGVDQCAWSGDDCSGKKCCNDANMKCFQKDAYFAGCKFEVPEGWVGKQLGEFRGWAQALEGVAPEDAAGTKLYCFTVVSPPKEATDDRPATNDQALMDLQQQKGWGIYQCDANSIFSGSDAQRAEWKSLANTDIFIQIWQQVKDEGKFWDNDFTVKVDPDACFFPDRLQQHLQKMNPPKDKPIYFKNCDFKFGFMGSLEIFSEKAIEELFDKGHQCVDKIGHEGGEDFYMMTCMDAIGVFNMADSSLLIDKYTTLEHLVLDDIHHCEEDGWAAALHPYKDPDTMERCYAASFATQQRNAGGGDDAADAAE